MAQKTLSGVSIALTREREANAELAALLAVAGATVHICPLIRITPPADPAPLLAALARIDDYDWLVLTSANAARAVFAHAKPRTTRVACIGEAAAVIAREAGVAVALQPDRAHSKGMLEALARLGVQGATILWPRSEIAPDTLKQGLLALGAAVNDPAAYGNEPDATGLAELARLLRGGNLHAIAFASPSAVATAAGVIMGGRVRCYSIGPSTTRSLRLLGIDCTEAAEHSTRGLADAIIAGEAHE